MATIKAIITGLDNLENNKEQLEVLRDDPLVNEIIFVNNGSIDGTKEWLDKQQGITVIHRENNGAGPGRNSGIDAAGKCDYFLFLDGGIRPLYGGTKQMLDYLERTPEADVIGVEIADFETDKEKAWRRWHQPIEKAYLNTRLSHTAYCLTRYRAFDGLRFCEEGPFGRKAWGAEDDLMAYEWNEAGIKIHVTTCHCKHGEKCTSAHPYRHASGSFRRLFKETGVWANQYGSGYEERCVYLQQNWPHQEAILQWGEPYLTVVVKADGVKETAKIIKRAHDLLRMRMFDPPFQQIPNPYSIVAWGGNGEWQDWAQWRRLRQHHGNTTIVDGEIVRRNKGNEATWTGDFRIWDGENWQDAVRPNAHYYGLVADLDELDALIGKYNQVHPRTPVKCPPKGKYELELT